jgi:DNA-binding MarR family transcriptional regulator
VSNFLKSQSGKILLANLGVADYDRSVTVELLTKHAHVILCVARDPHMRLRDIAECLGVTERSAQQLVCELEEGGYLTKRRVGRRNVYAIEPDVRLPHELEHEARLSDLLAVLDAQPVTAGVG